MLHFERQSVALCSQIRKIICQKKSEIETTLILPFIFMNWCGMNRATIVDDFIEMLSNEPLLTRIIQSLMLCSIILADVTLSCSIFSCKILSNNY